MKGPITYFIDTWDNLSSNTHEIISAILEWIVVALIICFFITLISIYIASHV